MANMNNLMKICVAGTISIFLASTAALAQPGTTSGPKRVSSTSTMSFSCVKGCTGEVTAEKKHLNEHTAVMRVGTSRVHVNFGHNSLGSLRSGQIVVVGTEQFKVLGVKRQGDFFRIKLEPISSNKLIAKPK